MANNDLDGLLEKVALGDRAAFKRLYDVASPRLFAVTLRILHDRTDAEEAVQDAFVKIWRYAERYVASRSKPQTWMVAIARNVAIDRLRQTRAPTVALELGETVADNAPRPDERTLARAEAQRLLDCIDGLGTRDGRLIRIAYFGGATYAALAERDRVPLGTVKSRMRKALHDLKTCLGA
ncbi:MAG: sigma-70 family RNA polymerase sigma factor [Pseudomonadota bacterium]